MITVRIPGAIYMTRGTIENGTFSGRWHFSFGSYHDRRFNHFGPLRVLNDDTLSPGAVWPLHPHKEIEVVTYCVEGEFRHADEHGKGGVLEQGGVQHTTVGTGMWHAEINNRDDIPMRFIQMWFYPEEEGLPPSVEQMPFKKEARTDRLLAIVSHEGQGSLRLRADAAVYSTFLTAGKTLLHSLPKGRGAYMYVLDGGNAEVNGHKVERLGALVATDEDELRISADGSELLLIDVALKRPESRRQI